MKYFFLHIFLSLLLIDGYSQILAPKWETCLGGSEWDEGFGIIKADNMYYIIGKTKSNDGDISFNHGAWDLRYLEIDSLGSLYSEKTYGGSYADGGFVDIKKQNDTIFYVTAQTKSIDGDISNNPWPGHSNIWILQINKQGEILWESVHGGSKIDDMRDMKVTDDGGVIALSLSNSDDGDVTNPNGSWDLWMIELNNSGEVQWEMSLGGEGIDGANTIMLTTDGGLLVSGYTDGVGGGNYDTTCNFHGYPGGGFVDAWIVKLDSLRNIEWQQCYGGTYHDFTANTIETSDGYVILGHTLSNDGDVSGNHSGGGPNSDYGGDIWVFKIDKQGNLLWQNCLGGLYDDFARNIFTTSDGGFMVVGTTQSDDGDVEGFNGFEPGGYDDVWLAKLDSTGNLIWQYCYGGEDQELLYRGVVQKSDYNYVITLGTYTYDWKCSGYVWPPDLRIVELYDTTVGITENKTQNLSVEVFPNPATERVNFKYKLPLGQTQGKLTIYNSSGILIRGFDLMAMQGQIVYNTSTLPNGVYFYTVMTEGKKETGKFVVVE